MSTIQVTPPPLSPQAMADLLCTVILLCRGKDIDGNPFWAYMCVKPSMANAFKTARSKGSFNLEDYGTILEVGEGDEIPPDVRERMERQYGVNHHYEDDLLKAVKSVKE